MSKDSKPTNPSANAGNCPAGGPSCCATVFSATPCRMIAVGRNLEVTASEMNGAPAGQYEWTTSSPKITCLNDTGTTLRLRAGNSPGASKGSEKVLVTRKQAGCPDVVQQVSLSVIRVVFSAAPNQRFGYDNFDTPANPYDDHVCIKKSDHTFVHVKIEGGAVGTELDFVCDPPDVCTPGAAPGSAEFDLRLDAAAEDQKETTLYAKLKCPGNPDCGRIKVHVYKQREVDVVVAKIDKTTAGANLRFATADYASHQALANGKLKEAVVKYNITNFDPANAVTPVNLASGTSTVTYDIAAGGGPDVTAIGAAMTGTGSKIRVAVIRDMKSVYYLAAATAVGATSVTVTAGSTFFQVGRTPPIGTGASRETMTITALAGNTITCNALTKAHAAGDTIEFNAAGWSSDPILIIEGSATLDVTKWTILHEVGHRALELLDIIDVTDFMHFSQDWTDYRLRYCPRTKNYPAGTTATENQWQTIPRT
jgi:hypothetical protein